MTLALARFIRRAVLFNLSGLNFGFAFGGCIRFAVIDDPNPFLACTSIGFNALCFVACMTFLNSEYTR